MIKWCCVQVITFRSQSEMVDAASKLAVGSLAFILSDELLFLRVQRGLREIQVDIFSYRCSCLLTCFSYLPLMVTYMNVVLCPAVQ